MKRKEYNLHEYLTGFLMGLTGGIVLEFSILAVYNFVAKLIGYPLFYPVWWMAVPLPIWIGFAVAKAIASLHLEDY